MLPPADRSAAPDAGADFAEQWRVHDAGLVLLHPFLLPLLQAIDCLDEHGLQMAEGRRGRATAMLRWLAQGSDVADDGGASVARVLTAAAPAGAPRDPGLPPAASDAADAAMAEQGQALLEAVIAHWSALGRTSVQGLRQHFVAREGLLRRDGEGWRLQVEPQAVDVLLQQLPWPLGRVRLPWMPAALVVDWTTA